MDGTLVDTEPYWMRAEHDLVAQFGGTWTDDDAHAIVGFDLLAAAERMRDRGGVPLDPPTIVECLVADVAAQVRARIPWRPGARQLLAALRDAHVPCALVTMSWTGLAREIVEALPADTFDTVVTGDQVTRGKPDPEPYRLAAHRLGVPAEDCVAIEDSPTGARSALAAGCVVLAVPNHVAIPAELAHVRASSLVDVAPADLGRMVATAPPTPGVAASDDPTPPVGVSTGGRGRRALVFGVAAAILAAVIGWYALGRDSEPPPRHPDRLVLHTWVPYWVADEAASELGERADAIDQLSPFWYRVTGADTIELDPNAPDGATADVIEQARSRGIPLVASILDATPAGTMAGILADPQQRAAHVDAVVAFAADGNWDGIDLDYEQFAFADGRDTWADTRPNWVAFVTELSARLHADGRLLTVSVPPVYDAGQTSDSGYWVYDYAAITPHVDAVRIMAYDYSVAASDPGPISPLTWVDRIIAGTAAASGDPSKLILGVPLYGRNWVVGTDRECPDGVPGVETVTNRSVDDLVARRGASPVYDPVTGEWSFDYEAEFGTGGDTCVQQRRVFFVDDDGVQQRIQRAVDAGFGGVALFALGYDDQEVWNGVAAIDATLAAQVGTGG